MSDIKKEIMSTVKLHHSLYGYYNHPKLADKLLTLIDTHYYRKDREVKVEIWQPIETAPKDGTWIILGYYPDYMEGKQQGGHPLVAYWHDTKKLWSNGHTFFSAEGVFSPTLWMPIPDSPRIITKTLKEIVDE